MTLSELVMGGGIARRFVWEGRRVGNCTEEKARPVM